MLGRAPVDIDDESGTTIVELLVGMAMGMIVLAGLSMVLIVVLHGNARVDARIEATDNARIAVTRIMEELHSACTAHGVAPIEETSNANKLVFDHAAGAEAAAEVSPEKTESVITYNPGTETLTQTDRTAGRPEPPRTLLSDVAPATGTPGIFTYSEYVGGEELEPLPATATGQIGLRANNVILVGVALTASPRSSAVADSGAAATVQNSATLRLTPPSSSGTEAKPCE
jgi:Tfp pilus assembly protein PilW